ncbi:uncharacterized protein LOC134197211 isoform X2 [Corticium candelabrum]|nr:uncharacterized protein LOC134197211 isoform X2 [Corticium candelabrum]XP_062522475.1 uncharacterized protein LOC134197211 isoform X2 [Corticium candelabrum]
MNFIGLHTYPYSPTPGTGRDEPTVWVGLTDDLNGDGTVKKSYPSSYANTLRNQWGYTSLSTRNYSYGSRQLYEMDCYGSSVQLGNCPYPTNMSGNNQVFDETGRMLKASFEHAHTVGVKTCIGSETPLSKPASTIAPLNLYYSKTRQDNFLTTTQCAECENLYEFVRIEGYVYTSPFPQSIPLSTYYNGQLQDNVLSPTSPGQGYGFVRIEGYAFPLNISLQGNVTKLSTYYNAGIHDHLSVSSLEGVEYARDHGYTLIGSVAAVYVNASVATTQDYYEGIFTRIQRLEIPLDYYWIWTPEGWEGGHTNANDAVFHEAVSDLTAAAQASDAVKASFKLATCGWVVGPLPDRSLFDKVLPSQYSAITSIDMAVGNTAVDPAYVNITKHDKWAIPWMEDDPGLTAPQLWINRTLQHMEDAKKYQCQGLLGIHWRTTQTSPQIAAMAQKSWNSNLTSEVFWLSWSMQEFGISDASSVFTKIESFNLPRPVTWSGGPGALHPDSGQCMWDAKYAFVDELSSMRSKVQGQASIDRFDYWLNTFKYMQAISRTECVWAEYNTVIQQINNEKDVKQKQLIAKQKALPIRIQLVQNATDMMTYLLQTVRSTGELGTIMNVMSHSLVHAINEQTPRLQSYLQHSLPPQAMPSQQYKGPPKLIVTTVRTMVQKSETLRVRAAVLSQTTVDRVTVNVRQMKNANSGFTQYSLQRLNADRNVFEIRLPQQSDDFEYYIDSMTGNEHLVWPPGAPVNTQTVITY